jgi:aminoglycoside phosphotransferase (APT) family kinase protein
MPPLTEIIERICQIEGLNPTELQPLSGGQVNHVFRAGDDYVLRVGAQEDARQRLESETHLLRHLDSKIPVPRVHAFGVLDETAYQIQQYIPGQKLHNVWRTLSPPEQDTIAAELAACMKVLHSLPAFQYGYAHQAADGARSSWADYLTAKFQRTLDDIQAYQFRMFPGFVKLAEAFFHRHLHVLQDAAPVTVHSDLTFMNILVHEGKIAALIDFEFAMHAPREYELLAIEDFCLYPNDYAEEDNETFCTGDFASVFNMLRRHDPELFEIPHLRRRMDLYHVEAALSSHIAWRKANLPAIPAERMAAKEFYLARVSNFLFEHGVRLF